MNILGISAFYHDSAACLVQDGRVVAGADGGGGDVGVVAAAGGKQAQDHRRHA